jgi:hypothetical protein
MDQSAILLFNNLPERLAMNKRIKVIEPNVSVLQTPANVSLNSNVDLVLTDFTGIKSSSQ